MNNKRLLTLILALLVIAISPTSASVTPKAPHNLQLQAGNWEGRFIANAKRLLEKAGGENKNLFQGKGRELMLDNWLSKKQIWLLRGVVIVIFLIQVGAYFWSSYRATNICKLSQPHSQYCDLTVVRKLSGVAEAIALSSDGHTFSRDGKTLFSATQDGITEWKFPAPNHP